MVSGNIIFFGTSEICIPFLNLLKNRFNIKLIITQPDAKGGRQRKKMIPAFLKSNSTFLDNKTNPIKVQINTAINKSLMKNVNYLRKEEICLFMDSSPFFFLLYFV